MSQIILDIPDELLLALKVSEEGEWFRQERPDPPKAKAHFLRWEIVEPTCHAPNMIMGNGPVKVKFILRIYRRIHIERHGIALVDIVVDIEGRLLWGTRVTNISLEKGLYQFCLSLPLLEFGKGTKEPPMLSKRQNLITIGGGYHDYLDCCSFGYSMKLLNPFAFALFYRPATPCPKFHPSPHRLPRQAQNPIGSDPSFALPPLRPVRLCRLLPPKPLGRGNSAS